MMAGGGGVEPPMLVLETGARPRGPPTKMRETEELNLDFACALDAVSLERDECGERGEPGWNRLPEPSGGVSH